MFTISGSVLTISLGIIQVCQGTTVDRVLGEGSPDLVFDCIAKEMVSVPSVDELKQAGWEKTQQLVAALWSAIDFAHIPALVAEGAFSRKSSTIPECHCKECDSRIQQLQLKEEGLALKYSKQIRQYHAAVNRIMESTFTQIDRELHVLYNDQFELIQEIIQEIIQERQNVEQEVERVRQDTRKQIKILKAGVEQIPGLILDDSHLGG